MNGNMMKLSATGTWSIIKFDRSDFPAMVGLVFDYGAMPIKQYTLLIRLDGGLIKYVTYLYWAGAWVLD
jgi:hypothetical protein